MHYRIRHPLRSLKAHRLGSIAAVVCGMILACTAPAHAEPVERLRQVLGAPFTDPAKRERALKKECDGLRSLGDLGRALVLRDWRDQDADGRVAAVDRPCRLALERRFEQTARKVLQQGNITSRLAALALLAEIGTTTHRVDSRHGLARSLSREVAALALSETPGLREAAARALGQIDPDPEIAANALAPLLGREEPTLRRAAADGLESWMRTTVQLTSQTHHAEAVGVTAADLAGVGQKVAPLAATGLGMDSVEVRRRCIQALDTVTSAVHHGLVTDQLPTGLEAPEHAPRRGEAAGGAFLPLLATLTELTPMLTNALVDAEPEVRFRAGRALEELNRARVAAAREQPLPFPAEERTTLVTLGPAQPAAPVASTAEDDGRQETVMALALLLRDPDAEVRRAALDTLEAFGPAAVLATPELVTALHDRDKFVRWAAARILGRLGPLDEPAVVAALALLLVDSDLDVRLAAATALEHWGPAARPALADLCRTLGASDAVLQLAALRALAALGEEAGLAALADLLVAARDPNAQVRQAAIQLLGKLGPAAEEAAPALLAALDDPSPEVQSAAGAALLNILPPGKQ